MTTVDKFDTLVHELRTKLQEYTSPDSGNVANETMRSRSEELLLALKEYEERTRVSILEKQVDTVTRKFNTALSRLEKEFEKTPEKTRPKVRKLMEDIDSGIKKDESLAGTEQLRCWLEDVGKRISRMLAQDEDEELVVVMELEKNPVEVEEEKVVVSIQSVKGTTVDIASTIDHPILEPGSVPNVPATSAVAAIGVAELSKASNQLSVTSKPLSKDPSSVGKEDKEWQKLAKQMPKKLEQARKSLEKFPDRSKKSLEDAKTFLDRSIDFSSDEDKFTFVRAWYEELNTLLEQVEFVIVQKTLDTDAKGVYSMLRQFETYISRGTSGSARDALDKAQNAFITICNSGKFPEESTAFLRFKQNLQNDISRAEEKLNSLLLLDEAKSIVNEMEKAYCSMDSHVESGHFQEVLDCAATFKTKLKLLLDIGDGKLVHGPELHPLLVRAISGYGKVLEEIQERSFDEHDDGDNVDKSITSIYELITNDDRFNVTEYLYKPDDRVISRLQTDFMVDFNNLLQLVSQNLSLKHFEVSTSSHKKLFTAVHKYASVATRVNGLLGELRDALSSLESPSSNVISLPIDSLDKQYSLLEKNVIDLLMESFGPNAEDGGTEAQMLLHDCQVALLQWRRHSRRKLQQVLEICDASRYVFSSIQFLSENLIAPAKRAYDNNDVLSTVRINPARPVGRHSIYQMNSQDKFTMIVPELLPTVIDKCDHLQQHVEQCEDKFGFLPSKDRALEQISAIRQRSTSLQAQICLKGIILGDASQKKTLMTHLRRFPLARRLARTRMERMKQHHYERNLEQMSKDDKFVLMDPYEGKEILDVVQEEASWYVDNVQRIVPNEDGQCSGTITFSTERDDSGSVVNSFVAGDGVIYAHAEWNKALRSIPIARNRNDSQLRTPDRDMRGAFSLELLMFVYLNGEQLERPDQPLRSFSYIEEKGKDSQECPFFSGAKKNFVFAIQAPKNEHINGVWDLSDDVNLVPQRLVSHLQRIGKGKHKVRVELCYRLLYDEFELSHGQRAFPDFDTPCSRPIASGEFVIDVQGELMLHNFLPQRDLTNSTLSPKDAQIAEDAISHVLKQSPGWGTRPTETEHVMKVSVYGDYTPMLESVLLESGSVVDVVMRYSLPCFAVFYRNPSMGWNREQVAIFDLSGLTPRQMNVHRSIPPCDHIAVGSRLVLDADLLPSEAFDTAGIKRHTGSQHERLGLKQVDLSKLDLFNVISDME